MGRTNYSIIGYGMTVEEARRDALARDREENGTQDGYSGGFSSSTGESDKCICLVKPVPAKRAKVERVPSKGALKWKTEYVALARIPGTGGDEETVVAETTKGACITKAREAATARNIRLRLTVVKTAVGGYRAAEFAEIVPGPSVMGQWRFSGEARE
jgi:hypothetical protein